MHIKRCIDSIDQDYLSKYKQLQKIKASKKGFLNDHLKMIFSISRLQDSSSEVVESNIQRNSRGIYSSNIPEIFDKSSLSTICSKSPESNSATPQKCITFFIGNNNTQKTMTSNDMCLPVAIADLVMYAGLSFIISQKTRFKQVLDLERTMSKHYQPPNRNNISKNPL